MVLDSSTREVFGVFQDGVDPIQVLKESPCLILFAVGRLIILVKRKATGLPNLQNSFECLPRSSWVSYRQDHTKAYKYINTKKSTFSISIKYTYLGDIIRMMFKFPTKVAKSFCVIFCISDITYTIFNKMLRCQIKLHNNKTPYKITRLPTVLDQS